MVTFIIILKINYVGEMDVEVIIKLMKLIHQINHKKILPGILVLKIAIILSLNYRVMAYFVKLIVIQMNILKQMGQIQINV